jgi:L-malate glycosyltransferase
MADQREAFPEPWQSNLPNLCAEMRCADRATSAVSVNKISILFLIDDFDSGHGGTEQHLLFLQRELPRDTFKVHFGVLSGLHRILPEAFPITPIMLGEGTHRGPRGAIQRILRLTKLIKMIDADIVHTFCRQSELHALLATKLAGCGKVLGVRRNIGYWHTWFTRWTARIVGALGAKYVANCEAARQFAAKIEWISPRRTTVIHNPVSAKRLAEGLASVPPRESLGLKDSEQVVGIVANVRPIKDYATLLRSARLVLQKHPHTRFLAFGSQEPDYILQMRQLAYDLGIDGQVSWMGLIPNPLSVLPLFDVAVLSSQSEAFSNALLEYAAAGVAIVATDVGGTRELVLDNICAFLVPPCSPELMANRICRLLEDDALRKRLGENAQRRVQMICGEDRILEHYSLLYRRLAGN